MEPYLFYGKVLPARALLTIPTFRLEFSHITSGDTGDAQVSIILNEVAITVHTKKEWDVFDLRNVVKNILQNYLNMVGYLKGFAYDSEITRVLNSSIGVDYVFGIDVSCISEPRKSINIETELEKLKTKTIGANGVFLNRCFNDLVAAMKYADDTGFYCYRAVESLRHHCTSVHKISSNNTYDQWRKFREVSGMSKKTIMTLFNAAKTTRHGGVVGMTGKEREKLFITTWNIVESYIAKI